MKSIRCSALPLAWDCPESQNAAEGEVLINESGEAAEVGTAFHRWMAAHIGGVELDKAALAKEHACDLDELSMLCAMGCKALDKLLSHFHAAEERYTETVLESTLPCDIKIVGTGDMIGRSGRTGLVLDWKTGRIDADYTHQTRGYALGLRQLWPGKIDDVVVITVWVRQGIWDIERIDTAQLASWAEELMRRLKNGRGNFNPGAHCQYCPRQATCPGRTALVRSSIADLSVEGAPVMTWTPETRAAMGPAIGEMLGRVKLLEKVAESFREMVRQDVTEHGPLSIGGGRQLTLLEVNKRVLDTAKARPVLSEWLSAEEIDGSSKISLSECEAKAIAKAGKGKGAQTKRDMVNALEEAGAVSVNTTHQLRETKEIAS